MLNNLLKGRVKCLKWRIPYRYITATLLCLGSIIITIMVVSFGTSFNHLLPQFNVSSRHNRHCRFNRSVSIDIHIKKNSYHWPVTSYLAIQHTYTWGSLAISLPSGVISDKYGGKYIMFSSMLIISVIQVIAPYMLSGGNFDFVIFIVWQLLVGAAVSMLFASMNSILSHWTPLHERGKLSCIVYSATQFAVTFHQAITNRVILATDMWNGAFFIYSGWAAIWIICFLIFGYSYYYSENPWMSQQELEYLDSRLSGITRIKQKTTPWFRLLTSIPLWALVIASAGHHWLWHVLIKNLSGYLTRVIYLDGKTVGLISAFAYLSCGCCTVTVGFIADYLTNNEYVHMTTLRKVYTTIGAVGPAIFLVAAASTGCHESTAIIMFILSMTLMGFYYGGTLINTLELAPNFSGTIMGLVNMIEFLPTMARSYVAMVVQRHNTLDEMKTLFWIHLAVLSGTNMVFMLLGTSDIQSWNYVNDSDNEERETNMNRDTTSEVSANI